MRCASGLPGSGQEKLSNVDTEFAEIRVRRKNEPALHAERQLLPPLRPGVNSRQKAK
jgi:hypothetical protein